MSTHEVQFLKEHIVRLQVELSKNLNIELLPNKEYLHDKKLLDPLLALYDHRLKEQEVIIKKYETEAKDIKKELKELLYERNKSANDIDQLQIMNMERQLVFLENENMELSQHLSQAESTLEAAAQKLEVYEYGLNEITTKYKNCVEDFRKFAENNKQNAKIMEQKWSTIVKEKDDKINQLQKLVVKTELIISSTKSSISVITKKNVESDDKARNLSQKLKVAEEEKHNLIKLREQSNEELLLCQNEVKNLKGSILEIQHSEKEKCALLRKEFDQHILKYDFAFKETQLKLTQLLKQKEQELQESSHNVKELCSKNRQLHVSLENYMKEPTVVENYDLVIHNLSQKLREAELKCSRLSEDYQDLKEKFQDMEEKFMTGKKQYVERITQIEGHLLSSNLEKDRKSEIIKNLNDDYDKIKLKFSKLSQEFDVHTIEKEQIISQLSRKLQTQEADLKTRINDLSLEKEALSEKCQEFDSNTRKQRNIYCAKFKDSNTRYELVIAKLKGALKVISNKLDISNRRIEDLVAQKDNFLVELSSIQKSYRKSQEINIELRTQTRKQNEIQKENLKKMNFIMEERRQALSKCDQLTLKLSQYEEK
eukprot:NODE_110_length_18645_cov_0.794403.p2 type:complete len:597 gc:universal NODE_110_length_18645_cov_0.794403:10472-12262(+)